jgi:hypothetical protein
LKRTIKTTAIAQRLCQIIAVQSRRLTPGLSILHLVFLLITLQSFSGLSAQQETNYAVHANIIYRFTKYIDWPPERKTGDFIIGVVGETPLFEELKNATAGKNANTQKIVVKNFSVSGISKGCHILFVSADEHKQLKKIIEQTAGMPILIVSEKEKSIGIGACINFMITHDRLKLEINKNNIDKRGLSIATELLQLGTVVNQ